MTAAVNAEALSKLRSVGLLMDSIVWDGTLHRVPVADKPRGRDGAYIAHADTPISIWWMNWRSGESGTWTAKTRDSFTPAEREALKQRMEANRKAREAEETCRHAEAAEKAGRIYDAATECVEHPYLTAKGVKPAPGLKVTPDGRMVVPLRDEAGKLVSLQFIDADGGKRFLTGGRKKGCFFSIGGKNSGKPLLIAEGLATGLSLYECVVNPCLVAFDAGNLLHVAGLARRLYPTREIILCADNDVSGGDSANVGVEKAAAAALAVNGLLAVPNLKNGGKCDWNDLHKLLGAGEVRTQITAARKAEEAGEAAGPPRLRCVDIGEFLRMDIPEREMLVAPILPQQGLAMLHAYRGIGKTYAALSIANAAASGGTAMSRWKAVRPCRVLFIDGEMPAYTLRERLAGICAGADAAPPDPDYLRILTPDLQDGAMPNLAVREGQEAIEPFLRDVELVVLDNLATLARHGRANDEESWLPVQGWLLSLRRRGVSVLLVHHEGKGGTQRGTSGKEDILDTVFRFARPKDYHEEQGARFEVHFTKARNITGKAAQPFEVTLRTGDGGAMEWLSRDIEDVRLEQVRSLLRDSLTVREIAAELGIGLATVQRLKKKLGGSHAVQ
jgi:putative DNA primase/helicase